MDLSEIDTESQITLGGSDSDEYYDDSGNERTEQSSLSLSVIDDIPFVETCIRIGTIRYNTKRSAYLYPTNGLSIRDKKALDVEKNRKRSADSDEASGDLDYRKPVKPRSSNVPIVMDTEIWGDLPNNDQFIYASSMTTFGNFDNETDTPETITKTISRSTESGDEQDSVETDDLITDSEEINEQSKSEEEKVKNTQCALSQNDEDEAEKMAVLLSNFSDEQFDRYEKYKISAFPKMKIKEVIEKIAGHSVSRNVVTAIAGIAKSFVGDIVEKSLDVKDKQGIEGPLQPRQIREAVRQLRREDKI